MENSQLLDLAKMAAIKVSKSESVKNFDVNEVCKQLVDLRKFSLQKRVELLSTAVPEIAGIADKIIETFERSIQIGSSLSENEYAFLVEMIVNHPELDNKQIKEKVDMFFGVANRNSAFKGEELRKNIMSFGKLGLMMSFGIATALLGKNSNEIAKQIGKTKRTEMRLNSLFWHKK